MVLMKEHVIQLAHGRPFHRIADTRSTYVELRVRIRRPDADVSGGPDSNCFRPICFDDERLVVAPPQEISWRVGVTIAIEFPSHN
jgi:hypothetical protein